MCGICGILKLNDSKIGCSIHRMTNSLKHRGPDDEGYYLLKKNWADSICLGNDSKLLGKSDFEHISKKYEDNYFLTFGFRRLSILDLSDNGFQPFNYLNKYILVFNGEIYNYLELKEELLKYGYIFKTKTDTEVITAAYDKWGNKAFNKFNGMWAFALYDKYRKKLILSRDRFGIKPLYYYCDYDNFIFASEIKSILNSKLINVEYDFQYLLNHQSKGIKAYLKETPFKGIYRFPSASYVEIDIEKFKAVNLSIERFWNFLENRSDTLLSFNDAKEKYRFLIEDSVNLRLRSDVRIGTALSGGLDSSTLVTIINKLGFSKEQITFSNIYRAKETALLNEEKYIDLISDYLGLKSLKTEISPNEVMNRLDEIVLFNDDIPENTLLSGWNVYTSIKQNNVKVTLDGQGADEIAGGYSRYVLNYLINLKSKSFIGEYNQLKHYHRGKVKYSKLYLLRLVSKFIPYQKNGIFKYLNTNFSFMQPLNSILIKDTLTELQTLLQYVDRISMANSIEVRLPFLDYRLVEFMLSVPEELKIRNGYNKYIMRDAYKNEIPEEILWRKDKMGFPNADEFWFIKNNYEIVNDLINNSEIIKMIHNNKIGINKFEPVNMKVRKLILALWFDKYFKSKKYLEYA